MCVYIDINVVFPIKRSIWYLSVPLRYHLLCHMTPPQSPISLGLCELMVHVVVVCGNTGHQQIRSAELKSLMFPSTYFYMQTDLTLALGVGDGKIFPE